MSFIGYAASIFVGILAFLFTRLLHNPRQIIPFTMLLTPFRSENQEAWEQYSKVNEKVYFPPTPVPEISAADYDYETIKEASQNFRIPVVVRGLVANTKAIEQWKSADYLSDRFAGFEIPIVRDARVGTLQDDRVLVPFSEAYHEMHASESSTQYLFFPVKSRFSFNGSAAGSAESLQAACDRICSEDLELHRIWPGFGTKQHSTFAGSQFVIGKSTPTFTANSTGSDWHCAIGNNWFIQAAGRKLWHFVEPKYSAYMHPLKGGMYNMWTGNKRMSTLQRHIPTRTVTLEEGDLLYNPDWTWHKVTNYGGLSIGIPLRERNLTLAVQNNPYFTSIVVVNVILGKLGLSLGGFPPASRATEQDN